MITSLLVAGVGDLPLRETLEERLGRQHGVGALAMIMQAAFSSETGG